MIGDAAQHDLVGVLVVRLGAEHLDVQVAVGEVAEHEHLVDLGHR